MAAVKAPKSIPGFRRFSIGAASLGKRLAAWRERVDSMSVPLGKREKKDDANAQLE